MTKREPMLPPWVNTQPKRLLLDAKPLTAFVVGATNPSLLGRKSTQGFGASDFELIWNLVQTTPLLVTPHLLAEVNSWLNGMGSAREELRAHFGVMIREMREHYSESSALAGEESFPQIGLTDSSILAAAQAQEALVITTDSELYGNLLH